MFISNLDHMETVSEDAVVGGYGLSFSSTNSFATYINAPVAYGNSAAAGAQASATNTASLVFHSN